MLSPGLHETAHPFPEMQLRVYYHVSVSLFHAHMRQFGYTYLRHTRVLYNLVYYCGRHVGPGWIPEAKRQYGAE